MEWLRHPSLQGIAAIATVIALIAALVWHYFPRGPSPVPEQVRAIERTEHETRGGSLYSAQSIGLHGDGTRSWVFVFAEGTLSRLVIYDIEHGRLRERFVLTSRVQPPTPPAAVSLNGTPYRRLSPSRKRLARRYWLLLHTPKVGFDKPSAPRIADGSRMLLVPTIAGTAGTTPTSLDFLRQTVVPVFWLADRGEYVVGRLLPNSRRWTVPEPHDLRLELRPGAGFQALPTANVVMIDNRARLIFMIVGGYIVQVHAFGFPRGPDDLEECPVLWQGDAPIGTAPKLPRLERELSRGCPHI